MNTLREEQCSGLAIDHLGLIADKIEDLDLISQIDVRLPIKSGHGSKVSMGERVAAMILNGLGFVNGRLYVFPEFLSKHPVERLFGKALDAEWFNDDSLARCLDKIAEYGTTKLFTELSFAIGKRKNLLGPSAHFDTTTLQVYGEYNVEVKDEMPILARGYSKSKRHDLKQMVLNLATTGKSAFPIWMEAHSGNSSDKKVLPSATTRMNSLCKQLEEVDDFIYVGDSAMYSNILSYSDEMKWLSRVANNIKPAKELLSKDDKELNWETIDDDYNYHTCEVVHKYVKQRGVMIYSELAYQREVKTLTKRISKDYDSYTNQWWHLSNVEFNCEKDALQAAKKLEKQMQFHRASYQVSVKTGYAKKVRPSHVNQPKVKCYKLEWELHEDIKVIGAKKRKYGRFILATNEFDRSKLKDKDVLNEYKAQSGVEKSFKFIKDNSFQVDSIFLKTPHRIEALMMIMTLCLMVYGVSQYELRKSLQELCDSVPDQRRKPTDKPSMKWVYFLFLGVQELQIAMGNQVQILVINVNEVLKRIVSHFGDRAREIYLNSG